MHWEAREGLGRAGRHPGHPALQRPKPPMDGMLEMGKTCFPLGPTERALSPLPAAAARSSAVRIICGGGDWGEGRRVQGSSMGARDAPACAGREHPTPICAGERAAQQFFCVFKPGFLSYF